MAELALVGVGHRYPDAAVDALSAIDVTVGDGELVSVVGPSGSGKTTLLRIAGGLVTPTAGRVVIDGRDVTALPTERRDLTLMFQEPHLFDHLDVAGNVGFARRVGGSSRRQARAYADRYLDLVHLSGLGSRTVSSLSGGQQQRVALARALAAERGVLLLDEPFSSLDRELRSAMHDLVAEVRSVVAPTIVMITHDLDEAALADRVVVLIDGHVHQIAPAALLYRRPASLAVARLVGGFAEIAGEIRDGVHRSAFGALPVVEGIVDGPAVALIRQEELVLGAGPGGGFTVSGEVRRVRPSGVRQVVTVGAAQHSVDVEIVDSPPRIGDQVVVSAREGARVWVVPAPPRST